MPFGRHRGCPLSSVDSSYLSGVARGCRNAAPDLLAAVQAELDCRRAHAHRPASPVSMPRTTAAVPGEAPLAVDHPAVLRLLADLIAAGVRVVCRGEGAIHCYGGLT